MLKILHRIITLLGHLPWLVGFLVLVPAVAKELSDLRRACFNRAVIRKEKGTKEKVLFHHLVFKIRLSLGIQD